MASPKALVLSWFVVSVPLLVIFLLFPHTATILCPSISFAPQQQQALESREEDAVGVSREDLTWVSSQMANAQLGDPPKSAEDWIRMRKGINPRTREEQLYDLRRYHGISHYEESEEKNHTRLPCPSELLVEQHHSNYGEPWAGGRDVFEFIAKASALKRHHRVLEVGCGTLRVGLHFIRFLAAGNYHCIEKDPLSLMAAFSYELPSQGLLHKRPVIVRSDNLEFELLGDNEYDVVYASAAFLHMPDKLVWTGLEKLVPRIKPGGRVFVSHNIKFCSRLGGDECNKKLRELKLEYVGKQTHDSLLFNHYEIWHQFVKV
ncbi:hypothetical protein SELMODRAFT_110669 [Selaginella moellendorffii]|uniref:Methyltransferase type 12 domain-containing protein n=1 Tax=Selaginella moellendorffii TaxID=88036 RepID=D8S745_SELML|nr:uncharacterized protein LOC9660175 [Selaginella moellendorffii]EFJ19688.1 hypothetical protein SELMODRAFT_110669 [Selaginella moellendorffii]|eukprot:XP_002979280.1 uncharacterized protein LOC9660175 [Selaginella moellendorffii]